MNSEWQPGITPRSSANAVIAFGVILIIGGVVALSMAVWTTLATVLVLGAFLLVAAVAHIAGAISHRGMRSPTPGIVAGVLSGIVGLWFLVQPDISAVALTTLLALYFVAAGSIRLLSLRGSRRPGRGWVILSGVASIVVGVIALASWPISSAWLPGILVGVDFIFAGASLISAGTLVRTLTPYPATPIEPRRRPYDETRPPAP